MLATLPTTKFSFQISQEKKNKGNLPKNWGEKTPNKKRENSVLPRRTNLNSTEKTLETEDQGKKPQKTIKEAPCGRNQILNFRTGPEEKIYPIQMQIWGGKPWCQNASGPQFFWYIETKTDPTTWGIRTTLFYKKGLGNRKPSVHPSGAVVTELEDAKKLEQQNCPSTTWLNWEPTPKVTPSPKTLEGEGLAKKGEKTS